jgi:hypothetical protein
MTPIAQESSKFINLKYTVILRTPKYTKWHKLLLSSLFLAKVMVIHDFFQEFMKILFEEISKLKYDQLENFKTHKMIIIAAF